MCTRPGPFLQARISRLHGIASMRMVCSVNRHLDLSGSKQKLWRPCREARALGL